MVSILAIPVFLILLMVGVTGVLTLFGVAWLFHHHFLKPLLGLVLVFIGALWFFSFSRFESMEGKVPRKPPIQAIPRQAESPDAAADRVIAARSTDDSQLLPAAERDGESARVIDARSTDDSKPAADQKPADPAAKPAWVDQSPHKGLRWRDGGPSSKGGNTEAYFLTATSGPYSTEAECERNLPAVLQQTVADFAAEHLSDYGAKPVVFDRIFLNSLIDDRYLETVHSSVGNMFQLHVLLPIDAAARDAIEQRVRERVVNERLRYTAMGTLAAFILLGGVYSALKASGGKSAGG